MCGQSISDDFLVAWSDAQETRASWIIGATLVSPDGESIGPINDLLIDEEDGTVTAAIVSVGGFLGFGS